MIKYIKPVSPGIARGLVAEIYGQIKKEFGTLGEPLTLHSPLPGLLAGVWCSFRESLLSGCVPRNLKEAVAVAVSRLNQCPYCIDAHTVLLRATSSHQAASSVQYGRDDKIGDPKMRLLIEWAKAGRSPGSMILSRPPFAPQEAPEIIGTALWIHYINRMAKIFLGKNLIPISSNPLGLRSLSERMGGWFFAGVVNRQYQPGASLHLLRDAALPVDLTWATPSPSVAQAFAGLAAAADEAGSASLPHTVRVCVTEKLQTWDGNHPGIGQSWLGQTLNGLRPEARPAGRLALLAAFAPDQLDENVVHEFRKAATGDTALLGALAWSSFSAARRIGSWIGT